MISLLRRYLAPYRTWISVVLVLLFLQALGQLYLPSLNADIINNGVVQGDVGYILRVGAWMLVVSLLAGAAAVVGVYYSSLAAMSFGRDLRAGLFAQGQRFSLREMNLFGAPSLITRNTNDVQQVQMFVVMGLTIIVLAPITAVGGVIMAVRQDAELSLTLLVIVPIMVALVAGIASRAVPLFRLVQIKIDKVNQVLREYLTGIRVIRAFIRTQHEEERFAAANADLTGTTLRVGRIFALLMPALQLVMSLSQVAIVWFGGHRVASDAMPVGNLFAFISYLMQILMSVMMATMVMMMLPRAAASADRINDVLDTVPAIHDPDPARTPTDEAGAVEFRDVTFGYPGAAEPVLHNVSFVAHPGQTTAIVGSTGSGKSTLINLVPRLYDVSGGQVVVDGVDVREQNRERLWSRMGLIPQKAFLFTGDVAGNLRFGAPQASDDELWAALRIAQGEDFVRGMPSGLASPIEQGGSNVSGGQRQRLAIARALVRRPAIYIFDDSFSALDFATDAQLRMALARDPDVARATVLIVAQRVSTIMHAEQILVLDEGRVVGTGTHAELMRDCPTYREIVLSQISEEEAA